MRLDGKRAFITGAGQGIGEAIALKLAEYGCDVAINDVSKENAEKARGKIEAMGRRAIILLGDVADFPEAEKMVIQAVDQLGGMDILVNNAGISPKKEGRKPKIYEIEEQEWDRVMAVNLKGVFNFSKAALAFMIPQRRGRIINIASITGKTGNSGPVGVHYVASKAGVIGMTKAMAYDVAEFGITVNAVAPGVIDSPLRKMSTPEVNEALKRAIPLGRFGTPEEVADGVLFLVSDFSKYITGETLDVTGGWGMN
jgi:3-oxoacyl-[acyl-carrier protein] reductase